jgi:hypothetical protein
VTFTGAGRGVVVVAAPGVGEPGCGADVPPQLTATRSIEKQIAAQETFRPIGFMTPPLSPTQPTSATRTCRHRKNGRWKGPRQWRAPAKVLSARLRGTEQANFGCILSTIQGMSDATPETSSRLRRVAARRQMPDRWDVLGGEQICELVSYRGGGVPATIDHSAVYLD